MPFRFRLQSVLRLQQGLERKQLARMQRVATALQRAEGAAHEIQSRLDAFISERQNNLERGSDVRELLLNQACDQFGRLALSQALSLRDRANQEWATELTNYQALRMQTEKLEAVRNAHLKIFEGAERKREQSALDEMHSLRTHRLSSDENLLI